MKHLRSTLDAERLDLQVTEPIFDDIIDNLELLTSQGLGQMVKFILFYFYLFIYVVFESKTRTLEFECHRPAKVGSSAKKLGAPEVETFRG
jgi:hypothetical protein